MSMLRLANLTVLAAMVTLHLAGCASSPDLQPKPVASLQQLEGKWQGTITVGRGPLHLYYLTINPDGSMVAQWGLNWQWGKVTLTGGDPSFEMSPAFSGTLKYYDGPDGRALTLNPVFSEWYAYVRPMN